MRTDPLIHLFNKRGELLELLGRVWEILYIEGNAPDIGKRRENFIKLLLRYELGLNVVSAPDTSHYWDFKVEIDGKWYTYSLKTTERPAVIKVAWDGFPSWERARSFSFEYPILYVTGNRRNRRIDVYVFTRELLERVRGEMGREFWWIPQGNTNPRGFGIHARAVRRLMFEAEREGNHVGRDYVFISGVEEVAEEYWRDWYFLLKRIANYK